MLLVNHFSNLAQACLAVSEKAGDLKQSLISLTTPVRHPGPITVSTDNATRFRSLEKTNNTELAKLQISLRTADEFNKNYTAVVDRACQEIETELRKLQPEGGQVTNTDLALATLAMNNKLRRAEKIAAYEIHTARRLKTGQNLSLQDHKLRNSQIVAHCHMDQSSVQYSVPKPGDTITSILQQPKHNARDMYLVTAATPSSVTSQRIPHPLSSAPTKFMSKSYTTHPKHTRILYSPPSVVLPKTTEPVLCPPSPANKPWSPTPRAFWESDSDDDEYEVPAPLLYPNPPNPIPPPVPVPV